MMGRVNIEKSRNDLKLINNIQKSSYNGNFIKKIINFKWIKKWKWYECY